MIAPDAEPESDRSATPPEALAAGQRTLAAIVFTDTVGFSKLMSRDEVLALRLVARDLDHMKSVCGAFGGQVLKSTGDGLLLLFTSAVQAVACALEIQRDFQKQNLELPKDECLRHRIGIHLGDVFQNGGDVMGDGVNIAARLQTEAVPGGICLSQTVYDVVRNRLPFFVNDLGARRLKNIGKVNAYQISPMESAGSGFRIGWYRWRSWAWTGFGVLALLIILGAVFWMGMHREYATSHPGTFTIIPVTQSAPVQPAKPTPAPAPVAQVPAWAPTTPASPAITGLQTATEDEFRDACFQYMTKYDFDAMETWMKSHDWPSKTTDKLAQECPKLNHLFIWAHQQMQKYSFAQPLKVVNKEKTIYYWPIPFGGVKVKIVPNETQPVAETQPATPGVNEPKIVTMSADQIQPMAMVGIIHTLLKEDVTPLDPLTVQLEQELHLFIQTYHIVLPNRAAAPAATNAPAVNTAAPNP
jgi:class 3 adenylate cyclase